MGVHQKFTLIWNQVAGLRLAIRISVPGFAVLLTKLHSSCPFFLMGGFCGWSRKVRTRKSGTKSTFAPPRKTVFHNRQGHNCCNFRLANAPDERSSSSQKTPQNFQALAQMGPGMALKEIISTCLYEAEEGPSNGIFGKKKDFCPNQGDQQLMR